MSDHSVTSTRLASRFIGIDRAGLIEPAVTGEYPKEPSFSCVSESVFGIAGTGSKSSWSAVGRPDQAWHRQNRVDRSPVSRPPVQDLPDSSERRWSIGVRARDHCGQATKGMWGMSWRQEAMKGVEGCEKPGEAVKQAFDPGIPELPYVEYIGVRGQRGELKHLSNRRKGKQMRLPE